MAHYSKHWGKIQHISPDGLEKWENTEKNESLLVGKGKKNSKKGKVHKSLKSKSWGGLKNEDVLH